MINSCWDQLLTLAFISNRVPATWGGWWRLVQFSASFLPGGSPTLAQPLGRGNSMGLSIAINQKCLKCLYVCQWILLVCLWWPGMIMVTAETMLTVVVNAHARGTIILKGVTFFWQRIWDILPSLLNTLNSYASYPTSSPHRPDTNAFANPMLFHVQT